MATEKRVTQQIRTVERLLQEYEQEQGIPLARFLTGFYKRNPQMGARDRRMASRLAYHYFRIGRAMPQAEMRIRLAIGEFLCSHDSEIVQYVLPELHTVMQLSLAKKLDVLTAYPEFQLADIFPLSNQLSSDVDARAFIKSLFSQPDLFIRLRPAHAADVVAALDGTGIPYTRLGESIIALPNGTALERIAGLAGKYVVQDYSSQQTVAYFNAAPGERWWDACAGAGGKSILMLDTYPEIELLVSDVRNSILRNLDERFGEAGITRYRKKIIDLTKNPSAILAHEQFDGIILDAPCTGSGTWGRTPEMITSFDERAIDRFAALQRQIATQVVKHLKSGKPLVYITCSVFREENEQVVDYLQRQCGLHIERMELLKGYTHRADSMFVARLVKPNL